jgi:hypothetical protein
MPSTAGYSGTPLVTKLGLRSGQTVLFAGAVPGGFVGTTLELPGGIELVGPRSRARIDLALLFVVARRDLARRLPTLLSHLMPDGACWVAWPKRASKVTTDMTEDVVRAVALPLGVVDNKVAAIDEVWSGLRLVVRRENRPTWPPKDLAPPLGRTPPP